MPQARTRAFVLGQQRSGEQDKRVHLLSRENGRMLALAPGACRLKNRFGSALELFSEADFIYYFKEDRGQITLSRVDPVSNRFELVSQPRWIFYFSLMSESLVRFLPMAQPEERVYRMLGAVLEAAQADADPPSLTAYFLAWLLRIQGTMFNARTCCRCGGPLGDQAWVSTNFRGLVCCGCREGETRRLNREALHFLAEGLSVAPAMSPALPSDAATLLMRALAHKLEYDGELSLTSLRCLPQFQ
ncbi:MAG: DNA repair protein RecO [Acidobacteriota bacterium]|jgi:DNA repair protein RecO (recombination protein O)|nr:DNA repair protein RecO [Acidobacteriota bacterium]